jgi:hypothetical protein
VSCYGAIKFYRAGKQHRLSDDHFLRRFSQQSSFLLPFGTFLYIPVGIWHCSSDI